MTLQGSSSSSPRVMTTARVASPLPTDTDHSALSPTSSNRTASPAATATQQQQQQQGRGSSRLTTATSQASTRRSAPSPCYDEQQVYNVALISSPMRVGEVERTMRRLFRVCGATTHVLTTSDSDNEEEEEEEDSLAVEEWKDMLHSYSIGHPHLKLPPEPILDTLTRAIQAAAALPCNTSSCRMSFLDFITFLESELELLQGDHIANYHLRPGAMPPPFLPPQRPPPCWTAFLAAIAPRELQILTGPAMVYYLRSIGAIHAMLAGLLMHAEGTIQVSNETNGRSNEETRAGQDAIPTATHTLYITNADNTMHPRRLRWKDEVMTPGEAERSTTSDSAEYEVCEVVKNKNRTLPRYMQPRQMDELSRSIIARARARRLMEQLRRRAIPVNRYGCFARLETEETPELAMQLLLESCRPNRVIRRRRRPITHSPSSQQKANNSNDTSSSGSEGCETADSDDLFVGRHGVIRGQALTTTATLSSQHVHHGYVPRLIPRQTRSRRVMFKMTGVANAVPAAVQRATFERLSKPQCDPRWFTRAMQSRPSQRAAAVAPMTLTPWPIRTDTTQSVTDTTSTLPHDKQRGKVVATAELCRSQHVPPQRASSALAATYSGLHATQHITTKHSNSTNHIVAGSSAGSCPRTPTLPQLLLSPYATVQKPHAPHPQHQRGLPRAHTAMTPAAAVTHQKSSNGVKVHDVPAQVEAACSATYPASSARSQATQRQARSAQESSSLCATVLAAQRALLSRSC